jgi:primosomal replication protein N
VIAPHANEVRLTGQVVTREALRYTPAGVPVVSLVLEHSSQQLEARVPRRVDLEIEATAIGEVAQRLDGVLPGQALRLSGFLAKRSRRSRRVVLHVNEFEIE